MFGLNENGKRTFAIGVVCIVLGSISVALRIICKRLQGRFGQDDFWIIVTLLFGYAAEASLTWGSITGGGGKEMKDILTSGDKDTFQEVANYLEGLLLGWTFYIVSSYGSMMSLLALYRHIFATPGYKKTALILMIVTTLWFVGAMVGNFIICIPFDSFWLRLKPGKCLNFNIYALAIGVVEVLLNTMILALPIRVVLGLHLPTLKKVGLTGIFLVGLFAVATCIVRVKLMYQPYSIYVRFHEAGVWGGIHLMVANICACLPVYKPLWKSIGRLSERLLKLYNSMSASSLLPSFVRRNKVKENNPEDPKAEEFFISLKGVPVSKFGSLGGTGNSEKPGGPSIVSTIAEERDMVRRYPNFDV